MAPSLEISQALNQLSSKECWPEVSYACSTAVSMTAQVAQGCVYVPLLTTLQTREQFGKMTIDEPGVEIAGPEIHNISAVFFI